MPFRALLKVSVVSAVAAAGLAGGGATPVLGKTGKEVRQCKALNKCRAQFTRCYYAIEKHPKKTWDTHEWECAGPYGKCIDANFGPFEMFFTRMFDPRVQDCSK